MNKFLLMALCTLALSACDTWKKKEPPLPGTRVSVLQHERSIIADADVAGTPNPVAGPSPNSEWPQSGGYPNHAMHHIQVSDSLRQVWSVDIGAGASDEESPGGLSRLLQADLSTP